jgi:hypothetical protein
MDLFQEFRKLILGDGLLKLIEDFRNPTFEDKLYFNAKYIPEKDAIHRSYFDEVRQANVETYTDFMPLLKKELLRIKQELRDHLSNAAAVHSETSELYKEAFDKSEVDFVIVRKKVAEEFTFSLYLNELQLFISDVESTYKSKLFSGTSSSSNPKKTLSFYFDGDVKILHKIYHELKFETGDFIDKEITTEKTFVDLLTSPDVLGVRRVKSSLNVNPGKRLTSLLKCSHYSKTSDLRQLNNLVNSSAVTALLLKPIVSAGITPNTRMLRERRL